MEKRCPVCNNSFKTISKFRKYCGVDCRNKFYEQKVYNKKKNKICKKCQNKKIPTNLKYCNKCNRIILNEQYERHKSFARKNAKVFYEKNKNRPSFKYKRNARYKMYHKGRREKDPKFEITVRLRNLLYQALNKYNKTGKAFSSRKYGIDFNKILEHLKPFPSNLNKWHIDHIRPLSSFNLEDPSEIQKAFAPENHQWLLASENIRKSNKRIALI